MVDSLNLPQPQPQPQSQPEATRELIINGEIALQGRFPYFVTLQHYCGGALIAPDVVLVAGHCKTSKDVRKAHYAHVGRYSFHHDGVEEIRVDQQVRHPSFKWVGDDEFIHDFLLLKLRRSSSKPIVKLNRHAHVPADHATVVAMGVGNTDPDEESKSDVVRQVNLTAISNAQCEASHSEERNTSYSGRIFPSMMCTTGGDHNERDACAYDSGSPIIIPGATPDDDILVALVSWGEDCADADFPGVNARVSDAFDWIRASVCAMSDDPPTDLCAPSTIGSNVTVDDSWDAFGWHVVTIGLGVTCLLLAATLCRRHPACRSSAKSNTSILNDKEELKELNGVSRCYSSTGHGDA